VGHWHACGRRVKNDAIFEVFITNRAAAWIFRGTLCVIIVVAKVIGRKRAFSMAIAMLLAVAGDR
jgi:hypothetical protein